VTAWVYARDIARGRDRDVAPALLAFAAPPFDADRAAGLGLTEAFAGLAPQLAEEVAAAAGAYLPGRHAVHLDGEAREAHLWEETGGYPVVPLAAPGRLDNASPFFSQIALAGALPEADAMVMKFIKGRESLRAVGTRPQPISAGEPGGKGSPE